MATTTRTDRFWGRFWALVFCLMLSSCVKQNRELYHDEKTQKTPCMSVTYSVSEVAEENSMGTYEVKVWFKAGKVVGTLSSWVSDSPLSAATFSPVLHVAGRNALIDHGNALIYTIDCGLTWKFLPLETLEKSGNIGKILSINRNASGMVIQTASKSYALK